MKFFTAEEKRVLLVLSAFLVVGLLVRQVRQPALSSAADGPARETAAQSFREASQRFVATAGGQLAPVDVNHATVEELQALPGIGPVLAKKIVDFRAANGYFRNVQDLRNVSGIGPKLLQRWEGTIVALVDSVH